MAINPLSPDETALLGKHCLDYVDRFAKVKLAISQRAITRQPRTLEYEQAKPAARGRTSRATTPEYKLLQRLSADSGRRIFVTGDPATGDGGSGKSEFTRQLAYAAAERARVDLAPRPAKADWLPSTGASLENRDVQVKSAKTATKMNLYTLIPIRYELKDLERRQVLMDRIKANVPISASLLRKLAKRGQLLFILDGLDEMRSEVARSFKNILVDFLRVVGTCPLVIAGRESSMRPDWSDLLQIRKDDTYRLEPFTIEQVEDFIRNYFTDPRKSHRFINSLAEVSQGVMPLLRQPFMLAMACSAVEGKKFDLPADPSKFMEHGLRNLLHRRHRDHYATLSPDLVLQKLGRLAAFAVDQDFRFTIEDRHFPAKETGTETLKHDQVLDQLTPHTGILAVQGVGDVIPEYSFTNRVVAEYLAGTHIATHGPVHFANDWYDQAISGETPDPDGSVKPGSVTALSRSLAFYGRHIWSDAKRNTLKWITAAWWRAGKDGPAIALRAGEWLVKHLSDPNGNSLDDVRMTLLHRFIDLLSVRSEDQYAGDQEPLTEALHGVVKPEWSVDRPFVRPFNRDDIYIGHRVLAGLKSKRVLKPYVQEIATRLPQFAALILQPGESGLKPWKLADLAEALAAIATGQEEWLMEVAADACTRKLGERGLVDSWLVLRLADAATAVAAGRPERLRKAADAFVEKLGEPGLNPWTIAGLGKALVAVAADQPQRLMKVADAITEKLGESGLNAWDVAGIAEALAVVAAEQPERLTQAADAFAEKLGKSGMDALSVAGAAKALAAVAAEQPERLTQAAEACQAKLLEPKLESWVFCRLAEAVTALATGREDRLIAAAEACIQKLGEPGLDAWTVTGVVQAVVAVATGGAERLRQGAAQAFTKKMGESGLAAWVVVNLAEALAVVAPGNQKAMAEAVAAILGAKEDASPVHHRAIALRAWTNQVVICGSKAELIEWREHMKWNLAVGGPDSAGPVQVRHIQREEAEPLANPSENMEAAANGPAFLLACREDLTPGLDWRVLPKAEIKGQESATGSVVEQEPTPPKLYCFRRCGARRWEIAFERSSPTHLEERAGFFHIARLLHRPGQPIPALDLLLAEHPELAKSEASGSDELLDDIGIKNLKAQLQEFEKDVQSGDPVKRAVANEEMAKIEKHLRAVSRRGGTKRAKTPQQEAQSRVHAALGYAYDYLEEQDLRDLAKHLRQCIRSDGVYGRVYLPPPEFPVWDVSWLEPTGRKAALGGE